MRTLPEHYAELWGVDASWRVTEVDLDLKEEWVRIELEATGKPCHCSACGVACALKDHAPQRQWRHLDTMQFETILVARVPRTNCPQCGVRTCEVPWAEPHGRFTLMFEAFAIRVLQAVRNTKPSRRTVTKHSKGQDNSGCTILKTAVTNSGRNLKRSKTSS